MFDNFFPKIVFIYEIMSKNVMVPEKLQMTIQYGAHALHAG